MDQVDLGDATEKTLGWDRVGSYDTRTGDRYYVEHAVDLSQQFEVGAEANSMNDEKFNSIGKIDLGSATEKTLGHDFSGTYEMSTIAYYHNEYG